jgi:hypothetical protein
MRHSVPSIGRLADNMVIADDLGEGDMSTPGAYGWTAVLHWANAGQAMENAENWATWGIYAFKS